MDLEILVCSVPGREEMLKELLEQLTRQLEPTARVSVDARADVSIGEKRMWMLEQADADYVSFIDDDDWVPDNYVSRMLRAIEHKPDVIGLSGVITTNGENPQKFKHYMANGREWYTENNTHYRPPNHLNPVRREIALAVGYKDMWQGEDRDYSMRLFNHLTANGYTEYSIQAIMYYYRFQTGQKLYVGRG